MRNADSWGTAFIVFGTVAIISALPPQQDLAARTLAQKARIGVPADEVAYKISFTAKRIPGECKNLTLEAASDLIARCQSITASETQVTMIPVNEKIQVAAQPQAAVAQ